MGKTFRSGDFIGSSKFEDDEEDFPFGNAVSDETEEEDEENDWDSDDDDEDEDWEDDEDDWDEDEEEGETLQAKGMGFRV